MMNLTPIEFETLAAVYTVAQHENANEYVLMGTVVDTVATEVEEGEELEEGDFSPAQVYGTLSTLQRRGLINVGQITEANEDGKTVKHKTIVMVPTYAKMLKGRGKKTPEQIVRSQEAETEQTLTKGLDAKSSSRETRLARLEKLRLRAINAQSTLFRAEEEYRTAVERAKAFGDVAENECVNILEAIA